MLIFRFYCLCYYKTSYTFIPAGPEDKATCILLDMMIYLLQFFLVSPKCWDAAVVISVFFSVFLSCYCYVYIFSYVIVL